LWRLAPEVARRLPTVDPGALGDGSELYFANSLSQRMVSYLGAVLDRRERPVGSRSGDQTGPIT
jgi:hypothetical protein